MGKGTDAGAVPIEDETPRSDRGPDSTGGRWVTTCPSGMLFGITTFTLIHTLLSVIGFPFVTLLPGHVIGGLSLVILAVVLVARYVEHLAPGLIAAAPTQQERPFAITQVIVLVLFVWPGRQAVHGTRTG